MLEVVAKIRAHSDFSARVVDRVEFVGTWFVDVVGARAIGSLVCVEARKFCAHVGVAVDRVNTATREAVRVGGTRDHEPLA